MATLYGGDAAAWAAHDPLTVLGHHHHYHGRDGCLRRRHAASTGPPAPRSGWPRRAGTDGIDTERAGPAGRPQLAVRAHGSSRRHCRPGARSAPGLTGTAGRSHGSNRPCRSALCVAFAAVPGRRLCQQEPGHADRGRAGDAGRLRGHRRLRQRLGPAAVPLRVAACGSTSRPPRSSGGRATRRRPSRGAETVDIDRRPAGAAVRDGCGTIGVFDMGEAPTRAWWAARPAASRSPPAA